MQCNHLYRQNDKASLCFVGTQMRSAEMFKVQDKRKILFMA